MKRKMVNGYFYYYLPVTFCNQVSFSFFLIVLFDLIDMQTMGVSEMLCLLGWLAILYSKAMLLPFIFF